MTITSTKVVKIALACNLCIMAVKGIAAWLSGSSALFSETLHSLADSINSVLLLVGIQAAARPPDGKHPFGYSRAIYFWSLIGAVLMFGVIASASLFRGLEQIIHGGEIEYVELAIACTALSTAFEGVAVYYAIKGIHASKSSVTRHKKGILNAYRGSGDPTIKMVLIEDCLSLSGVIIALVGLVGVSVLGMHRIDGFAGLIIGFMIGVFALYLIDENRKRLLGESASIEMEEAIRRYALSDPDIVNVLSLKTIQVGANKVLVYLVIELEPKLLIEDVREITRSIEKRIVDGIPEVIDCFIEMDTPTPDKTKINGEK
ncbi:MAG: cation transporter [Euryarchaeota archaeon]|nr:cation transporter [Euryarchaeota archaeon]